MFGASFRSLVSEPRFGASSEPKSSTAQAQANTGVQLLHASTLFYLTQGLLLPTPANSNLEQPKKHILPRRLFLFMADPCPQVRAACNQQFQAATRRYAFEAARPLAAGRGRPQNQQLQLPRMRQSRAQRLLRGDAIYQQPCEQGV
jgi:hypothetical protein